MTPFITTPGSYEIPEKDYREIPAFHYSMMRWLMKSPMHLKHYTENPEEPNEAMIFGSLVDTLALTPDLFPARYVVLPQTYTDKKGAEKPFTLKSDTCKIVAAEYAASGKTVIKQAMLDDAKNIVIALRNHEKISRVIDSSRKQVALVWIDSDTGLLCKALLDMLSDEAITDLKTTENASPRSFPTKINNFRYHIQGALYSDGFTALNNGLVLPYQIIASETDAPYACAIYSLEPDSLFAGREIYKHYLNVYKDCLETGFWPGYSQFVEPINIPPYALSKTLEEGIING